MTYPGFLASICMGFVIGYIVHAIEDRAHMIHDRKVINFMIDNNLIAGINHELEKITKGLEKNDKEDNNG